MGEGHKIFKFFEEICKVFLSSETLHNFSQNACLVGVVGGGGCFCCWW